MNSVWNLINDLNKKAGINEILINGPKNVFVEKLGQFIQINANLPVEDIEQFIYEVASLNKKECSENNPILDGSLPDGSRINIINRPFVVGSPAISIRKFTGQNISLDNENVFGLNYKWSFFIKTLIHSKCNLIISGGTGVGKTTFLNMLLKEIPKNERIVTIEDTIELTPVNPNIVRMEYGAKTGNSKCELTARDLVKNSLRMRPDRIIIGETRGAEIFDLLSAMNTGHEGSISSIHANNGVECLSRMENLYLMSGMEVPIVVIRKQIAQTIDLIIQLGRTENGERVVSEVIEINGVEGSVILTQPILLRDDQGQLKFTGYVPKNMEKLNKLSGLPLNYFEK